MTQTNVPATYLNKLQKAGIFNRNTNFYNNKSTITFNNILGGLSLTNSNKLTFKNKINPNSLPNAKNIRGRAKVLTDIKKKRYTNDELLDKIKKSNGTTRLANTKILIKRTKRPLFYLSY